MKGIATVFLHGRIAVAMVVTGNYRAQRFTDEFIYDWKSQKRQILDGRMSYMSMVQNDIPYILGRPAKTVREFLAENRDALIASTNQKE